MPDALSPVKSIMRSSPLFITIIALLWAIPIVPAAYSYSPYPAHIKLRVMTYNIHVGVGVDKKLDLQRIADVINDQHPDLVGLQEVDRGVKRTQGVDQIAELARLTRMQFVFAHNLDYQGGQYGSLFFRAFRFWRRIIASTRTNGKQSDAE